MDNSSKMSRFCHTTKRRNSVILEDTLIVWVTALWHSWRGRNKFHFEAIVDVLLMRHV